MSEVKTQSSAKAAEMVRCQCFCSTVFALIYPSLEDQKAEL